MFIVKCTDCGREQEWKEGLDIAKTAIILAGDTVVCDCGSTLEHRDWVMYEGKVED